MPDSGEVIRNLYVAKLERRGALSAAGRDAIIAIPTRRRAYAIYQDIVSEGDRPAHSCFVETDLVSRYKTLRNGARQIVSFHIRGDMVDLQSALVVVADHGIRAHAPTSVIMLDHGDILRVAAEFPDVGRALWFDTLIDAAIFREWTVNVGRRNARERTAHLLLEFAYRFKAAGMMRDDSFELPVSQSDLSDALGITAVHLNRTLQWLRKERFIRTLSKTISIENWGEMIRLAGFTSAYLHPEGPRELPLSHHR
jgi:CRP-like cAMP-binding protein